MLRELVSGVCRRGLIGLRCPVHLMAFMSNLSYQHCLFVFSFIYLFSFVFIGVLLFYLSHHREHADMRVVEVSELTVFLRVQGHTIWHISTGRLK